MREGVREAKDMVRGWGRQSTTVAYWTPEQHSTMCVWFSFHTGMSRVGGLHETYSTRSTQKFNSLPRFINDNRSKRPVCLYTGNVEYKIKAQLIEHQAHWFGPHIERTKEEKGATTCKVSLLKQNQKKV